MIIRSLLDTDLYKFTMMQLVLLTRSPSCAGCAFATGNSPTCADCVS